MKKAMRVEVRKGATGAWEFYGNCEIGSEQWACELKNIRFLGLAHRLVPLR